MPVCPAAGMPDNSDIHVQEIPDCKAEHKGDCRDTQADGSHLAKPPPEGEFLCHGHVEGEQEDDRDCTGQGEQERNDTGFAMRRNGRMSSATVRIYVIPVYTEARNGSVVRSSDRWDRYSEAPIESEAATPMMRPATAMIRASWRAKVRPASVPVNSTRASLRPSTTEPTYFSRSSSRRAIRSRSWDSSSARICGDLRKRGRQGRDPQPGHAAPRLP